MGETNKTLVAVVLAAFVGVAVVVLALGAALNGRNLSAEETAILSSVLGAAVGALATFLGMKKGDDEPPAE